MQLVSESNSIIWLGLLELPNNLFLNSIAVNVLKYFLFRCLHLVPVKHDSNQICIFFI